MESTNTTQALVSLCKLLDFFNQLLSLKIKNTKRNKKIEKKIKKSVLRRMKLGTGYILDVSGLEAHLGAIGSNLGPLVLSFH